MTLEEILKSKGLDDDQIKAVIGEMKQNKIFTTGEENLDVRYGKLKTDHDSKISELEKANGLIAELQKSTKGNEELQTKIADYQSQVEKLQEELAQTKVESAIKVALLSEKALDIDYLTFKLKETGEIELDDKDEIKGWNDKISALKTQFPTQFESSEVKKIDANKLLGSDNNERGEEPKNLADALRISYEKPQD